MWQQIGFRCKVLELRAILLYITLSKIASVFDMLFVGAQKLFKTTSSRLHPAVKTMSTCYWEQKNRLYKCTDGCRASQVACYCIQVTSIACLLYSVRPDSSELWVLIPTMVKALYQKEVCLSRGKLLRFGGLLFRFFITLVLTDFCYKNAHFAPYSKQFTYFWFCCIITALFAFFP